jgi:hypothetical protein
VADHDPHLPHARPLQVVQHAHDERHACNAFEGLGEIETVDEPLPLPAAKIIARWVIVLCP